MPVLYVVSRCFVLIEIIPWRPKKNHFKITSMLEVSKKPFHPYLIKYPWQLCLFPFVWHSRGVHSKVTWKFSCSFPGLSARQNAQRSRNLFFSSLQSSLMFKWGSEYNIWRAVKPNTVVWLYLCRLLKHIECSASPLGILFQGKIRVLY